MSYLIHHPQGFPLGFTAITHIGEIEYDTGITFGILKLKSGEEKQLMSQFESAYLLIQGQCMVNYGNISQLITRHSCFDEAPLTLHLAAHQQARIMAVTNCEFAVSQVENNVLFTTELFHQDNIVECEHRGRGILNNTSYRIVRTIFDIRNRPHAKLVLGEVITPPGRWSSYPPHHHLQPEIYHYRFTEPQGYGHAECGDAVFKVRQFDTYKILNQKDHAQVAAPGYGMYYIWVIRHLENHPYTIPNFIEEHSWTKKQEADERVWRGDFE